MASEEFGEKVKVLLEEIGALKLQVSSLIIASHETFTSSGEEMSAMLKEVQTLRQEAESAQSQVELLPRLLQSKKEHQALASRLQQLSLVESALGSMIALHEKLRALQDAQEGGQLWRAVELTCELQALMKDMKVKAEDVRVFQALRATFLESKEQLRHSLVEEMASAVVWEEDADEGSCQLRIMRSPEELQRLVSALEVVLEARGSLRKLLDRLASRLFLPFVRNERQLSAAPEGPGLRLSCRQPAIPRVLPPHELFPALLAALETTNEHLLSLRLGPRPGSGQRLAEVARCQLGEPLIEAMIDCCLARSLPASQEELEAFSADIVPRCAEFEARMHAWGLLETASHRLSDYVREIDALFLEKKKESLLVRARDLMRQPLFDISKVGEDNEGYGKDEEALSLPSCYVSKSVLEMIALFDATVDEGLASSNEEFKSQLYLALTHLMECYPRITATVHRDALCDVPQAAAIFHCNCRFLAHRCLLDLRLASLVPNGSLVHLVQYLRTAGNQQLVRQLELQQEQLDEAMQGFNGFQEAAENGGRLLGIVRHCCRQLGVLSRVWRVLPKQVFARVLGSVLHHVLARILADIIALPDIAANDCDCLLELLRLLESEGLALFVCAPVDGLPAFSFAENEAALALQLPKFVPSWPRLQELAFVLNASLAEISERWAAGKGPLAEVLTVSELRALVRALFQNTEKRAAVLAKLR